MTPRISRSSSCLCSRSRRRANPENLPPYLSSETQDHKITTIVGRVMDTTSRMPFEHFVDTRMLVVALNLLLEQLILSGSAKHLRSLLLSPHPPDWRDHLAPHEQ
jgi:hypothetical protein